MPSQSATNLYQNLLAGVYADGTAFEAALGNTSILGAWRELVGSQMEMLKAFVASTNGTNILEDVITTSATARRAAAEGPAANEAWAASWAYVTAILADTTALGYVMDDVKCLVHWAIQSGRTLAALLDDSDRLTVMSTELRCKNMAEALAHPQSKLNMQTYAVSGTYVGPAGAIWLKALICGAGGGGGGNGGSAGGGGGGGGQLQILKAAYGAIAAAIVVTIGAGGAGSATVGSAGGSSAVTGLATSSGGAGANAATAGAGGTSGTPSGSWSSDLDALLLNFGLLGLALAANLNLTGGTGGAGTGASSGGGGGGGLGGGTGGAASGSPGANGGGGGGRGQTGATGASGGAGAGGGGGGGGIRNGGGGVFGPTYGGGGVLGFGGGSGGQVWNATPVTGGFPGGGGPGSAGNGGSGATGGAGFVVTFWIKA